MSLETVDIVIIVAAVVISLLLVLCLINICYFLWLRRDSRFSGKTAFAIILANRMWIIILEQ